MAEILTDLTEKSLARAIQQNLFARVLDFGRSRLVEMHDDLDLLWYISPINSSVLSGIFRADFSTGDVDGRIDAAILPFRLRQVPMVWRTGPATYPQNLGMSLQAHGLNPAGDMPGMAVDLHALKEMEPPPGLTIGRVKNLDMLREWFHPFVTVSHHTPAVSKFFFELYAGMGFDQDSRQRHYIGWWDGKPVASSSLLLSDGVAGIYNVTTVPVARRQGIGTAMALSLLREARTMGYRVGTLISSEMAIGLYCLIGFREYCRIARYEWLPESRRASSC